MERAELVRKLEMVQPALSNNNLIPIMTHFWFRGDVLQAFDDTISITVPCETDFECAVPGMTLLNMLKASHASKVELKYSKNDLTVKVGATTIKLATMDPSNFNFDMPKPTKPLFVGKTDPKRFMAAISACLRSVSIDTSVPDFLGVTLIGDGKQLLAFATNHSTLSHSFVPLGEATKFKRAIIPTPFCHEMIALSEKVKGLSFEVTDNYALYQGRDGAVLFGKLVQSKKPIDYLATFDEFFPEKYENKLVAIPTKLEPMLDRAVIAASTSVTTIMTDISVEAGDAEFVTDAPNTRVHDTVKLERNQHNVRLRVDPKLVKAGYGKFTKMLLTDRAFILASDTEYFMVANGGTA